MKLFVFGVAALLVALGVAKESKADFVSASYTVSGSPGNYDLNFSLTNNMLAWPTQYIYFFAVRLSAHDITGSPSGWFDNNADANWFNYGGSTTEYNNTWITGGDGVTPGNTLSGFIVHDTDLIAPTSVSWSAVSYSNSQEHFTGGGNFITEVNPGFEGLATPSASAVPVPSTLVMSSILFGMIAVVWSSKRLNRAVEST